jgi:hypothetical protein
MNWPLRALAALVLVGHETPPMQESPLYHERLRPQFHFTPRPCTDHQMNPQRHEEGWINDLTTSSAMSVKAFFIDLQK